MKSEKISMLKMALTFILSLCLILSNILVVKPINLFGISWLENTCAIFTFPITYILSDVFSEVYGYKWSRITANFAFVGTAIASIMFAIMIFLQGSDGWNNQNELVSILGNTPQITIASLCAFWVGDLINDKIFEIMKNMSKSKSIKSFGLRAIISSILGKYIDDFIFTFFGLSFLPLETKISMAVTDPYIQIALEILLLPITICVMKKVKKAEGLEDVPKS